MTSHCSGIQRGPSRLEGLTRRAWPWAAIGLLGTSALLVASGCTPDSPNVGDERFNGQWVLESETGPMAMEVTGAGTDELAGSIVGAVGGRLQPFLEASVSDGRLSFRVAREFDSGAIVGSSTVAWFEGEQLQGETTREDREGTRSWVGRRPDAVSDIDDGEWVEQEPVMLFDGSGVGEWHTGEPGRLEGWIAEDGVLKNVGQAEDLTSNREFWNFVLHVEYRVFEGGNSGIGLRGRYEVQIYDDFGMEPSIHGNGAVYSRIIPSVVASKPHSEWQTFDIRLVGRTVTIDLNGVTIIDRQLIEGLTAMAQNANESMPGPISLQGDHGPIEFRRIVVTPLAPA